MFSIFCIITMHSSDYSCPTSRITPGPQSLSIMVGMVMILTCVHWYIVQCFEWQQCNLTCYILHTSIKGLCIVCKKVLTISVDIWVVFRGVSWLHVQFLPQMGLMGGPGLCVAHFPPDIARRAISKVHERRSGQDKSLRQLSIPVVFSPQQQLDC